MEIKPIKNAAQPKYPVKAQITGRMLKATVPGRWTNSTAAKLALGAMAAMTLTGCTDGTDSGRITPGDSIRSETPTEQSTAWGQKPDMTPTIEFMPTAGVPAPSETPIIDDYELAGEPMMPTITAAPLFVHGDGRGSMGCVMIAVFLSEQEALEVINEVAEEYGLTFTANEETNIYSVERPATSLDPAGPESDHATQSGEYMDMASDFTDENNAIALEYVSVGDVRKWASKESDMSASAYHTKDAAQQLQSSFEHAFTDYEDIVVGVMYDPCAQPGNEKDAFEDPEGTQEKTRQTAVDALKAQAKDFFEWLKEIGVL